jgi:LPS sulfotransferase NodH
MSLDVMPSLSDRFQLERVSWRARAAWTTKVDLVFLVGSPRSGSTWLQAMIAAHPAIYTGTETSFFMTFAAAQNAYMHPRDRRVGLGEYLTPEQFFGFMAELFWTTLSTLPQPPLQPKFFLEKTNGHGLCMDFILRTFPNARFIHIIRDGRAVVASMLRASKGWGSSWAPRSAEKAAQMWARNVTTIRAHARNLDARQYLQVHYEDLRRDPHHSLAQLYEWLGLSIEPAQLDAIVESNALENSHNSTQAFTSIPMTSQSNFAKINAAYPKGFIGPAPTQPSEFELTPLQRLRVEYEVGPLLHELGYPDVKTHLSPVEKVIVSKKFRRAFGLAPL